MHRNRQKTVSRSYYQHGRHGGVIAVTVSINKTSDDCAKNIRGLGALCPLTPFRFPNPSI